MSYCRNYYTYCNFDLLGSSDVISQVTISLAICGFLQVVNYNHTCILHACGYTESQIFWVHDLELSESRDVIGHMTIGLAIYGFL